MTTDKYRLTDRPKEELIAIIEKLTQRLNKEERIQFLAKWISPQAALEEAGEDDSGVFLKKIKAFCKKCMDGVYYHDRYDYDGYYDDDDYDNDDDDDYDDYDDYDDDDDDEFYAAAKVWADQFASFLKLAVIWSKNKDYTTAYKAFDILTDCIHEAQTDEGIFGTENPVPFIHLDWNEVFAEYFMSMKSLAPNAKELADKATEIWIRFPDYCGDLVLNAVDDIAHAERAIRSNIAGFADNWPLQHRLYELLNRFYVRSGLEFDEVETAKSMVRYNLFFKNDLAQAYINRGMWDEAALTIRDALKVVPFQPLITALKEKLIVCYEKTDRFREAYDVAVEMFTVNYSHELYIKARGYAVKLDMLENFTDSMEKKVRSSKRQDSVDILFRIFSYEGYVSKLMDTAMKQDGYFRHDYLKYTVKSLIWRAVGPKKTKLPDLDEYLKSIKDGKPEGIFDMIRSPQDREDNRFLLTGALGILKEMVQFHIDAAHRSRYAVAAYYCAVIKDIYTCLDEEETFNRYYENILTANKRRTALKEEMLNKVGKYNSN